MKKKTVKRILLIVIFIFAIFVIKPHIWHPFENTYSIEGTVKSVNLAATKSQMHIYVNFETTDGRVYNFYYQNRAMHEEGISFRNLTRLTEGDRVRLSIYSVGYYFVDSEKSRIAIYVKDVEWLK